MDWTEFLDDTGIEPVTIVVEAHSGSGARGEVYAAPVDVPLCVVQRKRQRVRVSGGDAGGSIVTSTTQVWCPLGTTAPALSKVTLPPDGTTTRVLAATPREAPGLDLPEHLELALE